MKLNFFKGLISLALSMPISSFSNAQELFLHEPITVLVAEGGFYLNQSFNHPHLAKVRSVDVYLSTFRIGKYEVTQQEFEAIMQYNPSFPVCANCPVNNVTLEEAEKYCYLLMEKTNKPYRLPTQAEWEWAAIGGFEGLKVLANGYGDKTKVAWYAKNSKGHIHPVGTLAPNVLGIYDMLGNVCEMTCDRFDKFYYTQSGRLNPNFSGNGKNCIVKGDDWSTVDGEDYGTQMIDGIESPNNSQLDIGAYYFQKVKKPNLLTGFRVVLEVEPN